MNLLIIAHSFPRLMDSESFCSGKFALSLAQQDHRITVICQGTDSSIHKIDGSATWDRLDDLTIIRIDSPAHTKVRRLHSLVNKIRSLSSCASWWTHEAIAAGLQLAAKENFDAVICRGISVENLYVGHCIATGAGLKLISILNDPPIYCFPPPYENRGKHPLIKRYELRLLKRIMDDSVVAAFPCDRLKWYMEKVVGEKFRDNVHTSPHIGLATAGVEQGSDTLEILHAGRIVRGRTADPFLRAFREALEIRPGMKGKVRLHILGAIDEPGEKMADEMGLTNVTTFHGSVSYEESLKMISAAEALLLIEAPMEEGIFLPSKLCDYAVAKKPLLLFSPKNGAAADLVGAEHPGVLGQEYHETTDGLIRFLDAWETGRDLTQYFHPEPWRLKGDYLVKELLGKIK
jgi:glycosyltransferase involved in cell wall biosynthesis